MSLQHARESRSLTQQGLADALGLSSKGTISGLETKKISCSIKLALQIEAFFDGEVSAFELVSDDDAKFLKAALDRATARAVAPVAPPKNP